MDNQAFALRLVNTGDDESTAIKCDNISIDYAELRKRVNSLALEIQSLALEDSSRILIYTSKNEHGIIGIVASLLAGRTYLPVPEDMSLRDVEDLANKNGCQLILHDSPFDIDIAYSSIADFMLTLNIADSHCHSDETCLDVRSNEEAVCLRTSGSTSTPKTVCINANSINTFIDWALDEFSVEKGDIVMNHSPLTFDLTFFDILGALAAGATILLTSTANARNGYELNRICRFDKPTIWHSTPTSLKLLLQSFDGEPYTSVEKVLFAGEAMPIDQLNSMQRVFPGAVFYNVYGCTETNDTFFYKISLPFQGKDLPIGIPVPYVDWRIHDENDKDAEEGELLIACSTNMERYACAKQTQDAFKAIDGKRFYRTKDRVRVGSDGLLYMMGRIDGIIKLNGYQVQLSYVEKVLQMIPGVEEAVAIQTRSGKMELAVMAYASFPMSRLEFLRQASSSLPRYSMPASVRIVNRPLPKNSHGKICRRAVSEMFE